MTYLEQLEREVLVAEALVAGQTYTQIADTLGITPQSVQKYVTFRGWVSLAEGKSGPVPEPPARLTGASQALLHRRLARSLSQMHEKLVG